MVSQSERIVDAGAVLDLFDQGGDLSGVAGVEDRRDGHFRRALCIQLGGGKKQDQAQTTP